MAPSFDIGNPQRSLVRIPGSGQDKVLKPICLDVAQISNFSNNLNEILRFDFNSDQEQTAGGTLNIIQSATSPSSTVLGRQDNSSQNNNNNENTRKRTADEALARNLKRPSMSNSALTKSEKNEKMKVLEMDEVRWQKENEELSQKVAMFRDILRSRTKLKDFLKELEALAC